MTRVRADAITAVLVLLAMLVAAPGCRRPQREAAQAARTTDARAAVAIGKPQAERPTDAKPEAARPNTAVPEVAPADSPPRPAGVPAGAFWVGGSDGGVFVLLQRTNDRKGTLAGKIYHPHGELWYAGLLVPNPPGTSVDPAQHDQFAGWDGERLLMTEGRWLESVNAKHGSKPGPH